MKQSWDSQMIDGAFPPKAVNIKLGYRDLAIKTNAPIDGKERVQTLRLKLVSEGVFLVVYNGKYQDGCSRKGTIVLDKNNLKKLKEWLDEVEKNV